MRRSEIKQTVCRSCVSRRNATLPTSVSKRDRTGANNPFYGKKHSAESIAAMKYERTDAHRDALSALQRERWLVNNPMKGKSLLELWTAKYGYEHALELEAERILKLTARMTGVTNPMYGKPAPVGAGAGWQGWYQGQFFRSLRELSFMLENPLAISAETENWRATYITHSGSKRTTVPDFVIEEEKRVIECKPKKLHQTLSVLARAEAIDNLAASRGYTFELVDPGYVQFSDLMVLYSTGLVILTKKTEERLKRWHSS